MVVFADMPINQQCDEENQYCSCKCDYSGKNRQDHFKKACANDYTDGKSENNAQKSNRSTGVIAAAAIWAARVGILAIHKNTSFLWPPQHPMLKIVGSA